MNPTQAASGGVRVKYMHIVYTENAVANTDTDMAAAYFDDGLAQKHQRRLDEVLVAAGSQERAYVKAVPIYEAVPDDIAVLHRAHLATRGRNG